VPTAEGATGISYLSMIDGPANQIYWAGWYEDVYVKTERAESLGFHSVWIADHIAIPMDYTSSMGSVLYETHTTPSVVAGRTSRLRLGCSVIPTPYRHPLLQARSLATLDQLSGGRVIYGGATAYMVNEFHSLGVDFPSARRRQHQPPGSLGVSLVVLGPNLFHEPTPLDVVDQIASDILAKLN
jgi:alkanesulfonate monooxygenase SsuD/methylene tetrahydromethanopterin reductase-like flavin-dependent oxidoreductase (luciferase family)